MSFHEREPVSPVFMISPFVEGGEREAPGSMEVDDVPSPPAAHEAARPAKPLPEVREPSASEIAKHSLTHLPYRRWCRWCTRARMPNFPHRTLPPFHAHLDFLSWNMRS